MQPSGFVSLCLTLLADGCKFCPADLSLVQLCGFICLSQETFGLVCPML